MARVTRSKKIIIAEDQIGLEIQTPLPDTLVKQPAALTELVQGFNNIPAMDEETGIATELKGLKAAYRNAIGTGKRARKGKSKKKDKQDSSAESEESAQREVSNLSLENWLNI